MSRGRITTLREVLKELIDKEDPEALLELKAPADEYNQEVDAIVEALKGKRLNANLIARTTARVFNEKFGWPTRRTHKDFMQMARKAIAVLGDATYV